MLLAQSLNVSDLSAEAEENSVGSEKDRVETFMQIMNNTSLWNWYTPGEVTNTSNDKSIVALRWYSPAQGLKIVNVTVIPILRILIFSQIIIGRW